MLYLLAQAPSNKDVPFIAAVSVLAVIVLILVPSLIIVCVMWRRGRNNLLSDTRGTTEGQVRGNYTTKLQAFFGG